MPIVVKGILRADDAELAIHHGVAAIAVSNHGARQFDGVQATVYSLEIRRMYDVPFSHQIDIYYRSMPYQPL